MVENGQYIEVGPGDLVVETRPAGLLNTLFERATGGRMGVDEIVLIPHANNIVRRASKEDRAVRVKDLISSSRFILARRE